MGGLVSTLAFPYPNKEWSKSALLERQQQNQLVYLKTRDGYQIPAIHIQNVDISDDNNSQQQQKFTLLYSHGNAEDVGLSLQYLDFLSQYCDCHVFAYEYCGYSIAEGEPTEQNCYQCIQSAYEYLTTTTKISPSSIVLFGRSLGTGPTVDLAAKLCKHDVKVGGCILQSPLESGGRCILSETTTSMLHYFDIFRNYEKIHHLANIPVHIIHGTNDRVVPCSNGRALHDTLIKTRKESMIKNGIDNKSSNNRQSSLSSLDYPPLWIPNVGHNDMPELECMQGIFKFLSFLKTREQYR